MLHLRLVVETGPLDMAADRLRGRAEQELARTHGHRLRGGCLGEVALGQRLVQSEMKI